MIIESLIQTLIQKGWLSKQIITFKLKQLEKLNQLEITNR